MQRREIESIVSSRPATDGAGVKLNRLVGFTGDLRMDPFLMLDEIRSARRDEFAAGFPAHPHRGFETVTYMREGGFSHEDSLGNHGTIAGGGVQWMTAGSGVIHSEMPIPDADRMHGFQFWLNLPANEKMCAPAYRDIQAEEIPELAHQDSRIRLIAGELDFNGNPYRGAVTGKTTQPLIADVMLPANATVLLAFRQDVKAQLYVYKGEILVAGERVRAGHLAYLRNGDAIDLDAHADAGALLFGGKPINEPIAHHGPFVMTTQDEIESALRDYRDGSLVRVEGS